MRARTKILTYWSEPQWFDFMTCRDFSMLTLGLEFSQMSSLLTFSIGWNLCNARAIEFSMSHEMKQILHYKLFAGYFRWKKVAQQGGVADIAGGGSHDSLLMQSISHCLQLQRALFDILQLALAFWTFLSPVSPKKALDLHQFKPYRQCGSSVRNSSPGLIRTQRKWLFFLL